MSFLPWNCIEYESSSRIFSPIILERRKINQKQKKARKKGKNLNYTN